MPGTTCPAPGIKPQAGAAPTAPLLAWLASAPTAPQEFTTEFVLDASILIHNF